MFGQEAFVNDFASAELVDVANGILKLPPLAVWGNLAIYIVAWALLMWPQHLPLGRPCIAMVFAAMACGLRELCHKAWPQEDYPTVDIFGKINPTPIALLFGLMLVNAYLKATQNERMHGESYLIVLILFLQLITIGLGLVNPYWAGVSGVSCSSCNS